MRVSAAEAEDLAAKGVEAAKKRSSRDRFWEWTKAHPGRILIAAGAIYFSTVCIPALVQQWADRQAELEFKNSLVTSISDLIADTLSTGIILGEHQTAEAAVRVAAARRYDQAGPKERLKALMALEAARSAEDKAELTLYNDARRALVKSGAAFETRLEAYFTHTGLAAAWVRYRSLVSINLELSRPERVAGYHRFLQMETYRFLCEGKRKQAPSEADEAMKAECLLYAENRPNLGDGFRRDVVGDEVLRRRRRLLGGIREANTEGYSVGISDYLCVVVVPYFC